MYIIDQFIYKILAVIGVTLILTFLVTTIMGVEARHWFVGSPVQSRALLFTFQYSYGLDFGVFIFSWDRFILIFIRI